jgi:probable HAF family extracellular repeat protein
MGKRKFWPVAPDAKPMIRGSRRALVLALAGTLSVMCADNGDEVATGDGGLAGEASTDEGGASGSPSTGLGGATGLGGVIGLGGAAGSQSIAGAPLTAGGASGGQAGAGGGAPRCAAELPPRCLATDAGAGGAAASSVQNAVAELVGADSVNPPTLHAVNDHGQIVGSQRCDVGTHAFLRDASGVRDLLVDEDDVNSVAYDINDNGVVVGAVGFEWLSGSLTVYPFIWHDGVTTVLRDLPGARAMAINGHDQVLIAGENVIDGGFFWENGVLTHLGPNRSVRGINDLGQVVGTIYKGAGMQVGFVWADGVTTELALLRSASAINDSGQIAGRSSDGTPVILDGASVVELGPPAAGGPLLLEGPIAITADGSVLGSDYVYTGGVVTALSGRVGRSRPFEEVQARGMNSHHVIVGSGTVLTFIQQPGGCRFETCEIWTEHAVIWKDECFAACCGEATGEGGAAGAGG